MSNFFNISSKESETSNSNTTASFLKRLRQNVTIPVPGNIKLKTESNSEDATSNKSIITNSVNTIPLQANQSTAAMNYFSNGKVLNSKQLVSSNASSTSTRINNASSPMVSSYKISQFESLLSIENVDLHALRKLSWNGIPSQYRTMSWQLMLGYLPSNKSRRESAISRKRQEYKDAILIYFNGEEKNDRTTQDGEILRQILVDLPRTSPHTPLFQQPPIQKAMERILYIWSIRHPASGYVQGMNDLLTPLILICLAPFVDVDVLRCDVGILDYDILGKVEADAYWCLTKLLDNIQDHYTFSQPGLQRMVLRLEDLVNRLDHDLHLHFQSEGISYIQFAFRWMNCLLLRELPLRAILRLWDTYFAEEHGGFENFHVYVCVVLLKTFQEQLMQMSFQELIIFLQDLPTASWEEMEIEPILSQAYILSTLFENSPNHLN